MIYLLIHYTKVRLSLYLKSLYLIIELKKEVIGNNFISYTFMNFIDNFKIRTIIEESISSFKFLDSVKVQDDISS